MFRLLRWCGLVWFLTGQAAIAQTPGRVAAIRSAPERPIIEQRGDRRFLNFDLIVRNDSALQLRISQIEVDIYDSSHHLALRRSLTSDAFAPSIAVIGQQTLAPGESLDLFNPFDQFETDVPLVRLDYALCFLRETTAAEREANRHRLPGDCDFRERFVVVPRTYENRTALVLPLAGRVFVWEGHDFYSHHLRVPLGSSKVRSLGITANSNEFASDFIYLDERGRAYHDDPRKLENWYGYGKPVYAPGAGVVSASANDIPDNWFEDANATRIGHPSLLGGKDPKDVGNFVLIDHGDGEYSLLVHLKAGSVRVRPGEHVERGQQIGRIGFAGDSIFPHLHYSLMDGPEVYKAWGLPAYFLNLMGARSIEVGREPVDSGDFVASDTAYSAAK
jgi:peptidase M23-like protein